MEHLLENYGEISDEEVEPSAAVEVPEHQQPSAGASSNELLQQLPPDVLTMFNDSEYDLSVERRRADERAKDTQWTRRFPHERGNWPTFVFVAVPNSAEFVSMAEASVLDFRQKLAAAWADRYGSVAGRGKKRGRESRSSSKDVQKSQSGTRKSHDKDPPEIVLNDMNPSMHQHLSLSKTVVLRAHQIDPFVQALKEAFSSSRRFTVSVVSGYDVLVNEDKSRSFVCLRVRGGRHLVLQLIRKSDTIMDRFKQPCYYEDPVVHVSIASVAGDVSSYVGSSFDHAKAGTEREDKCDDPDRDGSNSESEEDVAAPSEVCVDVSTVVCKAGTTLFQAPLSSDK